MSNDLKNGVINFGKGVATVIGCLALGAVAIAGEAAKYDEEKKDSENFKEVMTAIISSDINSFYQKELIQKLANKKLTQQQQESIIAICNSEMGSYYKYETIIKIAD